MSKQMSTKAGRQARADATGSISPGMQVKARVWLEKDGETFLASGRVALLERIDRYGSVTKAAKSMGISYRHAWLLLDAMNRLAGRPLVETKVGGAGGGGARLTDEGESAVRLFNSIRNKFKAMLERAELKP
jgi:molybdate transport system regulatory protein